VRAGVFVRVLCVPLVVALTGGGGACRNIIVDPDPKDAGPGGEGEGEGEGEGGPDCPNAGDPAVSVLVEDAATGFAICDATVRFTDGAFTQVAIVVGQGADCRHEGGFDRPGTYDIAAERAGYTSDSRTGLQVEGDVCGSPLTELLKITLTPE
jgi:hypothetical protein